MSPTHSLVGSQSTKSNQSFETAPETQPTQVNRQILNIRQALAGNYTGIKTREEPYKANWGGPYSSPLWMNTDFWESHSAK